MANFLKTSKQKKTKESLNIEALVLLKGNNENNNMTMEDNDTFNNEQSDELPLKVS